MKFRCNQYPTFPVIVGTRIIRFKECFLETDDPKVIEAVKNTSQYSSKILWEVPENTPVPEKQSKSIATNGMAGTGTFSQNAPEKEVSDLHLRKPEGSPISPPDVISKINENEILPKRLDHKIHCQYQDCNYESELPYALKLHVLKKHKIELTNAKLAEICGIPLPSALST